VVYLKPKQLIIKDCVRRFVLKLYSHEAARGLFAIAELLVLYLSRNQGQFLCVVYFLCFVFFVFFVYFLLIMWVQFLSRVSKAMLTRDIDIRILSVRLSVRPSVCPSRSGIVSKRLNVSLQFLHRTVADHSSLLISNIFAKFWGSHPFGAKYRCGIKISRFSTNNSLHIAKLTCRR